MTDASQPPADEAWHRQRLQQIVRQAQRTTQTQRLTWLLQALRLAQQSGALARLRAQRASQA